MTEFNLIKISDLNEQTNLTSGDLFLIEGNAGGNKKVTFNTLTTELADAVGAGEASTGSNLGTGARVFESKNGADLQFRTLVPAASNKIIINENDNNISVNVDEAQFEVTADLAAHEARTDNPHNVTATQVGNTTAQWNAAQLRGRNIAATAPTAGQALIWDGASNWVPGNVSSAVTSVNGQTGAVVLNTGAIAEGTNLYYTDARVDARIAAANLATNASLSNYVTLATDQTLTGTKTFSTIPVLPVTDPTLANQATRKGYVDGLDGQNVKLTGAQTIAGVKTFSSNPISSAVQSTATNALTRKDYVDTQLAAKADDSVVVKLSGAQTIAGIKTFSSEPVIPTATLSTSPVTKAQLDSVSTTASNSVQLTGDQSVGGTKTFSTIPVLPATDPATANQATRKGYVDGLDASNVKLTGDQTVGGAKTFSLIPLVSEAQPATANSLARRDFVTGLDAANVKTTGNQSIGGTKTFTANPISSAAQSTAVNALTRKDYVDGLDAANVKLTGAQTVNGIKTFGSIPVLPASDPTTANEAVRKSYVDTHTSRTDNPHGVTAAQVGNTTAQWNANQLQGRAISTTAPTDTQVMVWNGGASQWQPQTINTLFNQYLNAAQTITTSPYVVTAADNNKLIRAQVFTGATINLPPVSANNGMIVGILRVGSGSVTIIPNGTDNIAGTLFSYTLTSQRDLVVLRSNGSSTWDVLSYYQEALEIAKGGTGATTAEGARANLGLDLIPISGGGTGATTVAQAQENLKVPFRTTENITSNINIAAGDDGKILTVNSGSANISVNLPSSVNISNGFTITIVKIQAPNEVRINRSGTDLIGGLTQFVLTGRYASVTLFLRDNVWYVQSFFNGAAITP